MTLHIGLIGSDGFVIASDTLRTWAAADTPNNPQRGSTKKILFKSGLVWACAGFNPHIQYGYELLARQVPVSLEQLRDFSIDFFKKNPVERQLEQILLGDASQPNKLWHVTAYAQRTALPNVAEITDKITNQAPVNAHFVPALLCDNPNQHSTEELLLPAALTIWYGERENNGAVKGLQAVVCRNGELRELEPQKIKNLQEGCATLHGGAYNALWQLSSQMKLQDV